MIEPLADIAFERLIVGTLMVDADCRTWVEHGSRLVAADFADGASRLVYAAIARVVAEHRTVAPGLVERALGAAGLEAVGGSTALRELVIDGRSMPTVLGAAVRRVSQLGRLRRAREVLRVLYAEGGAEDAVRDPDAYLAALPGRLAEVLTADASVDHGKPIAEYIALAAAEIDERRRSGRPRGWPTGIDGFDSAYGGLHPGQLVVVAARPGAGKSSLVLGWAESLAGRGTVRFQSLEMAGNSLALRLSAERVGCDVGELEGGAPDADVVMRLGRLAGDLGALPLVVDPAPQMTVDEIAARAMQARFRAPADQPLVAVVVDYLQLLEEPRGGRRGYENRERVVAQQTRALKLLAKELGIAVVVAAQLNRAAESAERPSPRHLRESGAIEQDADVIVFPFLEGADTDSDAPRRASLIVAKHRNGKPRDIPVWWHGRRTRFASRVSQF